MTNRYSLIPLFIIVILYCSAVSLNRFFLKETTLPDREGDIIERVFGALRIAIGDIAYMRVEEYHHRGLTFAQAMGIHKGESLAPGELEHHHEGGREETIDVKGDKIYTALYRAVKVTEDSHLAAADAKEVLPWFYMETLFSPHDSRGFVLGSYWLTTMKRYKEALDLLKKGELNNPDSALIAASLGHYFYYQEKDNVRAVGYLEKARRLWNEGKAENVVNNRYAESERYYALDLLGDIYESQGRTQTALGIYQELAKEDPFGVVLKKIERLTKN